MQYSLPMKTATLPPLRVDPEFREEVEAVLEEGESLSEFVEASIRSSVQRRRDNAEFIARGIRALDAVNSTGVWIDADDMLATLRAKVDAARERAGQPRK